MTKAKLVLTALTIVTRALLFAGVGLVGFAASRQDNPLRAGQAGKEPNPPDTGPERKQGAAASGATATNPQADQGSVVIQAEVGDQDGRRLPGADVLMNVRYSRGAWTRNRSSSRPKPMPRAKSGSKWRKRTRAKLYSAYVWAHQNGRALPSQPFFLGEMTHHR